MKRLILFLSVITCGLASYGQCSKSHQVFQFSQGSTPTDVHRLGANPEFPFLRNLSTPAQVVAAMRQAEKNKKYERQVSELNDLLKDAGFAGGIKDVKPSNVTAMDVPAGTTGNMGDGRFHYIYARIDGGKTYKAWKVASGDNCYISFLSPCGNAFYPGDGALNTRTYGGNKPNCKEVAVSTEPREIEVDGVAEKHVTKKTYVYYEEPGCCNPCGGCCGGRNSKPLLVKTEDVVEMVPQTYKVTAQSTGKATVCNDTLTALPTDLKIERESVYTGNMPPEVKKEYVKVSEREYWAEWHKKHDDACGCSFRHRRW